MLFHQMEPPFKDIKVNKKVKDKNIIIIMEVNIVVIQQNKKI